MKAVDVRRMRLLSRLRLAAVSLAAAACAFVPPAHAQVEASLVAAESSISPGRPFTVALNLRHAPGWHTYWTNPGTGLPTRLAWRLPQGFAVGPIQWPVPNVVRDASGKITGNGYEGDLLLPARITPPDSLAADGSVTLAATAEWLMCAEFCIPETADLELTLPIAADVPRPNGEWGARIARVSAELPRKVPQWPVTASRADGVVRLAVKPAGQAVEHAPGELHFFSNDGYIAYDLPQQVKVDSRGGYTLTLPVSPDAPPTPPARLLGVLAAENGWQPDGSQRGLEVDVPFGPAVGTDAPVPAGVAALGAALGLAFLGGLVLNLMPCVLPVLGIKVLGFAQHSGASRRDAGMHGLVFTAGVLLSFWVLAGLLALLRSAGQAIGWGFQLQSPAFVFSLAVVMLVFGLNLSGVFEVGLRATGVGSGLQTRSGHTGSFFAGVLATVVATPCSAPFLAPALGAALTLPTAQSFAVFTAVALGLSAPYLVLSLLPGAMRLLPRPGAWMASLKQFMAFPLYATAAWLVWVLAGQVSDMGLLAVLMGLTLIALAAWVYGRWCTFGTRTLRARASLVACISLLALGGAVGWPRVHAPVGIMWEEWSPQAVASLRAQGRPIYVDFTARWCATCQTNKTLVFGSAEVRRAFAARNVAALKADWTRRDPQITAELARWGRSAVPFNLVYLPGRDEPVVLPELLTPGIVLDVVGRPADSPGGTSR